MTEARVDALTDALIAWLPHQRWFAGKGRTVHQVRMLHAVPLIKGDPGLTHAVVAVRHDDTEDMYQLLVGARSDFPDYLAPALLGRIGGLIRYEATGDPELAGHLLDLFESDTATAGMRFEAEPDVHLRSGLRARLVGSEQSNSSLIFGQQYILKLFRRLEPGPNRDLDLHRALRRVGCRHIAEVLGSVSGEAGGQPVVFGMLQRFLPNAAEGWAMATASVRDLIAGEDLPPAEAGGDFAAEAHRLGQAVATVHADLATALGAYVADAADVDAMVGRMHRRLDATLAIAPELAPTAPAVRAAFEEARTTRGPVEIQYVHGDLHLGQTLRTTANWLLTDFEGEPATPLEDRILPTSPLRDVAGMLRSFDYAAHQLGLGQPIEEQQAARAQQWAQRNRDAFCSGYAEIAADPREQAPLLRALELEKAAYEVTYEHERRPDWLSIPLDAIDRLIAQT